MKTREEREVGRPETRPKRKLFLAYSPPSQTAAKCEVVHEFLILSFRAVKLGVELLFGGYIFDTWRMKGSHPVPSPATLPLQSPKKIHENL